MRRGAGFFAGVAARTVVALGAVAVLGVTAYGWVMLRDFNDRLVVTDALGDEADSERPLDGTVDILLVGMDSRTDANGEPLSDEQRKLLRVDAADGEVNTDTIILLHVPTDTSRAVAVSIPRDSYVEIPGGYGQHKINSAYPRGLNEERQRLLNSGVKEGASLERRAHSAGARLLVKTVEKLTGRTIDHYASVNLLGFYDITNAVGGVEVCLKNPVEDIKSHADFPAGRQVVSGRDALAFVRQRQGLPRGDLDRVVRQQVFLTGMTRRVLSAGTLSDPARLGNLIDAITGSVVLSRGWDIFAFAQRMSSLSGGQVQFRTIPVGSLALATPEDGAAVEVDPERVQQFIATLSGSREVPDESTPSSSAAPEPADDASPEPDPEQPTGEESPESKQPAPPPIVADGIPCVN